MTIRRINIYGAPSTGKSTLAAGVFYELKKLTKTDKLSKSVEHVQEYVKLLAHQNIVPVEYDQFYIFTEQLRREELLLRSGVDLIVTDCPLLLNCAYADIGEFPTRRECLKIAQEFEKVYPSINFYLTKSNSLKYIQKGRYQTESQSMILDKGIKEFVDHYCDCQQINFEYGLETIINDVLESIR